MENKELKIKEAIGEMCPEEIIMLHNSTMRKLRKFWKQKNKF